MDNNLNLNKKPKINVFTSIYVVVAILIILAGVWDFMSESKNNSDLTKELDQSKKERYTVDIDGITKNTKILVNGITAFNSSTSGYIDKLELTQFMTNGDNNIEITSTSVSNDSSCNFRFGYIDLNKSENINDINYYKEIECGDVFKTKGVEEFKFNVNTNLRFVSPWLKGKKFVDSDETKTKLIAKYKEMQSALNSQDENKLKSILKYKFQRDADWMYMSKDSAEQRYIKIVKSNFSDGNSQLLDTLSKPDKLVLDISKDGLVARLIFMDSSLDSNDLQYWEPLMWYNSDKGITVSYPVWFMITQDGEIIPII